MISRNHGMFLMLQKIRKTLLPVMQNLLLKEKSYGVLIANHVMVQKD